MKTKAQKIKEVERSVEHLVGRESVLFADISGLTANDMGKLRRALKENGAVLQVIKKRLLKFVLEKAGVRFDSGAVPGEVGAIFSSAPFEAAAQHLAAYAKQEKKHISFGGGYALHEKQFVTADVLQKISELPSRDALLGQLVATIAGPIRSFLYVLSLKAKRS